jgi:hypothetical protein
MSEILKKAESITTRKDKIAFLKSQYTKALHEVLAFGYDPRVVWTLPETDPPYNPCETLEAQGMLYSQARKLYLFVQGGSGGQIPQARKEQLFIQLLESVDPEDAKLLLSVKNKKIPYRGITQKLVEEAYGVLE